MIRETGSRRDFFRTVAAMAMVSVVRPLPAVATPNARSLANARLIEALGRGDPRAVSALNGYTFAKIREPPMSFLVLGRQSGKTARLTRHLDP
jgi:hypothetical protein